MRLALAFGGQNCKIDNFFIFNIYKWYIFAPFLEGVLWHFSLNEQHKKNFDLNSLAILGLSTALHQSNFVQKFQVPKLNIIQFEQMSFFDKKNIILCKPIKSSF